MKKTFAPRVLLALSFAAAVAGCASMSGSTVLVDGTRGLDNFNRVGDANWSAIDGAIQATAGGKDPGYLVTKVSYTDFVIRAEFWASDDANSGIFIRCQNPAVIGDETCYEANIFDQRPDPTYGTGAIVKVAAVSPMPKAGGKWNTYLITAKGSQLTVVLNGQQTVNITDSKFPQGPFALQYGMNGKEPGGAIKWRKVEIRPL